MNDPARDLTRHASWLHRLALSLVGDSGAAEDLTQDTWVAFFSSDVDRGRPVRPWLRRVATNFARRGGRRREKPSDHASEAPGPEDLRPDEITQRLETERLLTDALGALEEPLRTTVYLRFYEGLAPKEIAERLSQPAGTVRWRLKRGLEKLRERLDREVEGGREAWAALCLPLARLAVPEPALLTATGSTGLLTATSSVGLTGILAMNSLLKIAVALSLGVALYLGLDASGALPAALSLARGGGAPVEVSFRPIAPEIEATEEVVLERETPPAARVAATPAPSEPVEPRAATNRELPRVRAIVVDERGAPVVGAKLSVAELGETQTDDEGRAALEFDLGDDEWRRLAIRIEKPGRATFGQAAKLLATEDFDLGRVTLGPGGSIRGRVLDERGAGLGAVRITWTAGSEPARHLESRRYQSPELSVPSTKTRADGRFLLEGLAPGHVRLWAHADGYTPQFTDPIEVRAGQESYGVELALRPLDPDNHIVLQVVDPEGNPVPFAQLDYRHQSRRAGLVMSGDAIADEEGRHEFLGNDDMLLWITASDPSGRFGSASASEVETGERLLVLTLRETRRMTLTVKNADGSPNEAYALEVRSADGEFRFESHARAERPSGTVGYAVPDQPYLLRVIAPLAEVAELGPLTPDHEQEPVIRLRPLPGLHGVVLRDGEPVAGAEVTLHEARRDDVLFEVNGFRCLYGPSSEDHTTTDDAGRFHVTPRAMGHYVVRAQADGSASADCAPFTVVSDLRGPELELHLREPGAIEGKVLLADGANPVGTIVGISRGDGRGRTVRVGADGHYRFEGLMPGPWDVVVRDEEIAEDRTHTRTSDRSGLEAFSDLDWDCEVVAGETTYHDLRTSVTARFRFEGSFRTDREEQAPWTARLLPPGVFFAQGSDDEVQLDEDGRFSLPVSELGEAQLVLFGAFSGSVEQFVVRPVHTGLDSPLDLKLSTGVLVLEGAAAWDGQGIPELGLVHEGPGGSLVLIAVGGDEHGVCRIEDAPAGTLRLVRPDPSNLDPTSWETIREIEVSRTGETRVEL